MNVITRTVAEFEALTKTVELRIKTQLTWDEWERLVKAVEDVRMIRVKITQGRILPGDWVNGFIATQDEEYKKVMPGMKVTRNVKAGWVHIYEGDIHTGDLMYMKGVGWVVADSDDYAMPITEATYGVLRREDRA